MTRILGMVLATLFLASCAQPLDIEFDAKSEHLTAKATISELETDFKDGFAKLSGTAVIHNTTLQSQEYSNMWLLLGSTDGVMERAYLDNLTSHFIDTGTVEIEAGDTIEMSVYWVVPDAEIEHLKSGGFVLEIRPDGKT